MATGTLCFATVIFSPWATRFRTQRDVFSFRRRGLWTCAPLHSDKSTTSLRQTLQAVKGVYFVTASWLRPWPSGSSEVVTASTTFPPPHWRQPPGCPEQYAHTSALDPRRRGTANGPSLCSAPLGGQLLERSLHLLMVMKYRVRRVRLADGALNSLDFATPARPGTLWSGPWTLRVFRGGPSPRREVSRL